MKRILLAFIATALTLNLSVAQENTPDIPPSKKYRFNPSIGAGIGILKFYGDIEDVNETTVHRFGNRFGYNFSVSGNISNSFEIVIDAMLGELSGNENSARQNRNFESDVFGLGAKLHYNFNNFYKKGGILKPFLSIGFSYTDYDAKADLYDINGEKYYYWSDGLIRNQAENGPIDHDLKYLERDFDYETSIRDEKVISYAIPATLGLGLEVGKGLSFRVSSTYFYTFTDLVDNFDNSKFSKFNDRFLYNSISVHWYFLPEKKEKVEGTAQAVYFADFSTVENEDQDNDGVNDMIDKCAGTPATIKVDNFGCPLDGDNDGIPDYLDKETNTASNRIVYPDGVAISFQKLAEEANDSSLAFMRQSITEAYINSQPRDGFKYTVHVGTFGKEIPPNLHKKIKALPGLIEKKINDTLTIFTLGSYEEFDQAEKRQNELIASGIDESFAVAEDVIEDVAPSLNETRAKVATKDASISKTTIIETVEEKEQVLFKVRLTEYRLRLDLDRLSQIMAKHGVEMRTSPGGMKIYTIGAFKTQPEAEKLRAEILKLGIKEAEVVGIYNNKGVAVEKALDLLDKKSD